MGADPAKRFHQFVSSFPPVTQSLPAMHVTFGRRFVAILDSKQISVGKKDSTLQKAVSFHFYGKPSYRPKPNGLYSRRLDSALFCIILDYDKLPQFDSVLPFDSGGYTERYSCLCGNIGVNEFLFLSGKDIPRRLVNAFFGSNEKYWEMSLRDGIDNDISKFDFHSSSLIEICRMRGPVNFDQRALSFELHYKLPIDLSPDNVLAVVAPDLACEEQELIDFSSHLNADLLSYPLELEDSQSQQRQIRDRVKEWFGSKPEYGVS